MSGELVILWFPVCYRDFMWPLFCGKGLLGGEVAQVQFPVLHDVKNLSLHDSAKRIGQFLAWCPSFLSSWCTRRLRWPRQAVLKHGSA